MNHVKNKFRATIQEEKVKLWVKWMAKMKDFNPAKVIFWNKPTAWPQETKLEAVYMYCLYANSYQSMLFCDTNEQDTMPLIIICKFFTGVTWDTFLAFTKKARFPCTYHEGVWRTGGMAPSILILSTKRRWVIIFVPWPLYSWNPLNRTLVGHQSQSRYLCVCQEWQDSPSPPPCSVVHILAMSRH